MHLTALGWWLGLWAFAVPASDETPSLYEVIPRGEALIAERGCLSCHAASPEIEARLRPNLAPRLEQVGARLSPAYLRRYLTDPRAARLGSRMPDLLGAYPLEERREIVEDLLHFLVSRSGPIANPKTAVHAELVEAGRRLYHEIGCIACHAPFEPAEALEHPLGSLSEDQLAELWEEDEGLFEVQPIEGSWKPTDVALTDLGGRTTVPALARFLKDPLSVRPGGRMPSFELSDREAEQLALYLLRERAERDLTPGFSYQYFEARFDGPIADLEGLVPARTGSTSRLDELPEHRADQFAFRFQAMLEIDRPGTYRFYTTSDDGSRLWIDDRLVVQNDGVHPMQERSGELELGPGRHSLKVVHFEREGGEGLRVEWSGPGFEKRPLTDEVAKHEGLSFALPAEDVALTPDPERIEAGQAHFARLGCASCHAGLTPEVSSPVAGPPLERLDAQRGCLGEGPTAGLPFFDFDPQERLALRATLEQLAGWSGELPREERIVRTLARYQCFACHRRGELGSPRDDRRSYFVIRGEAELGDEGRIPPHLDHVGNKLRRRSLEAVLLEGESVRPYMAARMPQFGADHVAALVDELIAVDARPEDAVEPPFSAEAVRMGRQLAGTEDGLGCINCHTLGDYDSLGVPAVDLAIMTERLRPGWFRRLLLDPMSVNMITRMPRFWLEGKSPVDLAGSEPGPQIDALWTYLSLGDGMPLPQGLAVPEAEYELEVLDETVMCGVFMAGVSPRTLVVGNPESLHYAFDVQGSRLAKAWRGRFFNAKGTWHARAGALESPPTSDFVDLAPGVPFAVLRDEQQPWPKEPADQLGYRVLGRRFDETRRPTFRYRVEGVTVEEKPVPRLERQDSWLVRQLRLESDRDRDDLWLRAAVGRSVQTIGPGVYLVDARLLVQVPVGGGSESARPLWRVSEEEEEVLVPIRFEETDNGWVAELDVELTW